MAGTGSLVLFANSPVRLGAKPGRSHTSRCTETLPGRITAVLYIGSRTVPLPNPTMPSDYTYGCVRVYGRARSCPCASDVYVGEWHTTGAGYEMLMNGVARRVSHATQLRMTPCGNHPPVKKAVIHQSRDTSIPKPSKIQQFEFRQGHSIVTLVL